jgi:hypothetical protein
MCLLLTARALWAGEITGRITLDEKPAAGVTVHAFLFETTDDEQRRLARREPPLAPVATAVTDGKGEYRLVFEAAPGAPGRLVWVSVGGGRGAAARYVSGVFDTSESEELDEIALVRAARVTGRVVDAAGAPVAGADVFLGGVSYPLGTARTGGDGSFAFEHAGEGGNDVHAAKAGFAPGRASDVRPGAPRTIVLARPAALSGRVLAQGGERPAAGALVRASGRSGDAYAETDAEGRFTLPDLATGRVSLSVRAGEAGAREAASVPVPFASETPLVLTLAPVRSFAGRVWDAEARRPLAGARVRVFVRAGRGPVLRTDAAGRFSAAGAGAVTSVTVSAPRYVPVSRTPPSGAATLDVFLHEGATVTGRVTDDERRPVAGAKLRALRTAPDAAERILPAARARDDGTFTLRRVPAGSGVTVAASAPDFEPAVTPELDLKPGEARGSVALILKRGHAITGVVTDAAGSPVAEVQIFGSGGASRADGPARAHTGKDGRFRLGGLAPGEYSLYFQKTGYERVSRAPVRVTAERGPEPLAVVLGPEGVIRGRVAGRQGGRGAAIQVFARPSLPSADGDRRGMSSGRVGPDGTFEIAGLRQGASYDVSLLGTFEGDETRKGVVAPSEGLELVTRGFGRIAGRVLDANGHPVPEFRISLSPDRSERARSYLPPVSRDFADETGAFELDDVPAGTHVVNALARGQRDAFVSGIVVEEGQTKDGVEVRLGRGATLRGRVVEAQSGRPVPEARVSAGGVDSTSDADGRFEAEGVAPGKVQVSARHADYAAVRETATVGDDGGTVELRLSSGGTVTAAVVSPAGEPVAGARASLALAGGGGGQSAVAGADGRAILRHVPAGRYTLTASEGGRTSKAVEFALGEDESRDDLRAVLGGGATLRVTVSGLSPDERTRLSVGAGGRNLRASDAAPDGRFELKDLAADSPVSVYVSVNQPGGPGEATSGVRNMHKAVQTPAAGGSLDVEVAFEPGFSLTVRVTRGGAAVERAWVSASSEGQAGGASATTDASGGCRLPGLKAGKVRLSVSTNGNGTATRTLDLAGDQSVEIEIPNGRIAGRVVAAGSGEPLGSVAVFSAAISGEEVTASGHSDSTGKFTLENVPAGPRKLTASLKGWISDAKTVDAAEPGEIVIEMRRSEGLEVRARDGITGTPLARVSVRIQDGTGRTVASSSVTLDGQGVGEAPVVPAGVYTVFLGGPGYAPARVDGAAVPGPAVAASLTPGGTLAVDVAADRVARGPLDCRFTGPGGQALAWSVYANAGEYRLSAPSAQLRNFPPVAGTLSCQGFAGVPFTVIEGGTTRIAVK